MATNFRTTSLRGDQAGAVAGVLALMSGLFLAGWSLDWFHALLNAHNRFGLRFTIAEAMLAAALLVLGAILLLMRSWVGRMLTVIGCVILIADFILALSTQRSGFDSPHPISLYIFYPGDAWSAAIYALFPVATLMLTLLPSTSRWCDSPQR